MFTGISTAITPAGNMRVASRNTGVMSRGYIDKNLYRVLEKEEI